MFPAAGNYFLTALQFLVLSVIYSVVYIKEIFEEAYCSYAYSIQSSRG